MVDPSILTDQHLNAERLELNLAVMSAKRSFYSKNGLRVGDRFTLGTGHVIFFHNKLGYLKNRYDVLTEEMLRRGMNPVASLTDTSWAPSYMFGDYNPVEADFNIVKERIRQRILQKPEWYRYKKEPITLDWVDTYYSV